MQHSQTGFASIFCALVLTKSEIGPDIILSTWRRYGAAHRGMLKLRRSCLAYATLGLIRLHCLKALADERLRTSRFRMEIKTTMTTGPTSGGPVGVQSSRDEPNVMAH